MKIGTIAAAAVIACGATGCGFIGAVHTTASSAAPVSSASPPQPAPVDTSAALDGNCVMGYESPTIGSDGFVQSDYRGFQAGPPTGSTIDGDYWAPAMAYQLTLTNNSGVTADVAQFAVVFYDATGTEVGSDQQDATGFITPGQSLTWTELSDSAVDGTGDGGSDPNIPVAAATCQLVQWYHP